MQVIKVRFIKNYVIDIRVFIITNSINNIIKSILFVINFIINIRKNIRKKKTREDCCGGVDFDFLSDLSAKPKRSDFGGALWRFFCPISRHRF